MYIITEGNDVQLLGDSQSGFLSKKVEIMINFTFTLSFVRCNSNSQIVFRISTLCLHCFEQFKCILEGAEIGRLGLTYTHYYI